MSQFCVAGLRPRAQCCHSRTVATSVLIAMASRILRATGHLSAWKPCTRSTMARSAPAPTGEQVADVDPLDHQHAALQLDLSFGISPETTASGGDTARF